MPNQVHTNKSFIGRSVPRLEDKSLLTGHATFVDDLDFPNQRYMVVVRSPIAYGDLRSIDTATAAQMPGIDAVWTSADIADIPELPFRATRAVSYTHLTLPTNREV